MEREIIAVVSFVGEWHANGWNGERTIREITLFRDNRWNGMIRVSGHNRIQLPNGGPGPAFGHFEDGNEKAIAWWVEQFGGIN